MRSRWEASPTTRAVDVDELQLCDFTTFERRCDLAGLVADWAHENGARSFAGWDSVEFDIEVDVMPTLRLFAHKRQPGEWGCSWYCIVPDDVRSQFEDGAICDDRSLLVGFKQTDRGHSNRCFWDVGADRPHYAHGREHTGG